MLSPTECILGVCGVKASLLHPRQPWGGAPRPQLDLRGYVSTPSRALQPLTSPGSRALNQLLSPLLKGLGGGAPHLQSTCRVTSESPWVRPWVTKCSVRRAFPFQLFTCLIMSEKGYLVPAWCVVTAFLTAK